MSFCNKTVCDKLYVKNDFIIKDISNLKSKLVDVIFPIGSTFNIVVSSEDDTTSIVDNDSARSWIMGNRCKKNPANIYPGTTWTLLTETPLLTVSKENNVKKYYFIFRRTGSISYKQSITNNQTIITNNVNINKINLTEKSIKSFIKHFYSINKNENCGIYSYAKLTNETNDPPFNDIMYDLTRSNVFLSFDLGSDSKYDYKIYGLKRELIQKNYLLANKARILIIKNCIGWAQEYMWCDCYVYGHIDEDGIVMIDTSCFKYVCGDVGRWIHIVCMIVYGGGNEICWLKPNIYDGLKSDINSVNAIFGGGCSMNDDIVRISFIGGELYSMPYQSDYYQNCIDIENCEINVPECQKPNHYTLHAFCDEDTVSNNTYLVKLITTLRQDNDRIDEIEFYNKTIYFKLKDCMMHTMTEKEINHLKELFVDNKNHQDADNNNMTEILLP